MRQRWERIPSYVVINVNTSFWKEDEPAPEEEDKVEPDAAPHLWEFEQHRALQWRVSWETVGESANPSTDCRHCPTYR